MKVLVLNECIRDARGSVKTIGQLITVEAAALAFNRAIQDMDHLAIRQCMRALFASLGWPWGRWMVEATHDWPTWPANRLARV